MTIPYQPRDPVHYRPRIALIGCGGITVHHLTAYRAAGYDVVALCDVDVTRAEARRAQFFPDALVTNDASVILRDPTIAVVDIATHPADRVPLIEAALRAGKHVLSQKPFVLDLVDGERLVALAQTNQVQLAVNQNGRWAPHVAYMRGAIAAGLVGTVSSVDLAVHWDHNWVVGTPFDAIDDLLLYDFAIHWFDMLTCYFPGQTPLGVSARVISSAQQRARPPLLGHVMVEYPSALATMSFNADTRYGGSDRTLIVGDMGTLSSSGPGLSEQHVTLTTAAGSTSPVLAGSWFPDGFHGTMAELLCAIAEQRAPTHSAANNLTSLALCFAAIASSRSGTRVVPGMVRSL
jgi:predicted dehydrogenase